jgi:tRNA nucleotidyltransferase (CCA-adding enzyme)
MKEITKVIKEAESLVVPSKDEVKKVNELSNMIVKKVVEEAKKSRYRLEVELGGSLAKGTWLSKDVDVDVFVKFPKELSRDDLEVEGIKIGMNGLKEYKPYLRYAEHPYVECYVKGIRVNVVPCFKVKRGEWKSAADRSPYHTQYIKSRMNDEISKEVRLLKKFVKGINAYGAEIKVKGFSGYVCEVLTLKFGSFLNVVKEISRAKENLLVAIEDYDKRLVKSFKTPIIILDPIDSTRNLGAAISCETYSNFIVSSRSFLKNPSLDYFTGIKYEDLEHDLLNNAVALIFKHEEKSVDILWGQLRRSLSSLARQLEKMDFKPLIAVCCSNDKDESSFLFLLESLKLSKYKLRVGPKVFWKDDCDKFIEKNKGKAKLIWLDDACRINALIEREIKDVVQALNYLTGEGINSSGIAPGLAAYIAKSKSIVTGKEILIEGKSKRWLMDGVKKIASRKRIFG